MRPQARHMRFFNPSQLTTSPIQLPRERLDPGPPPGRAHERDVHPRRAVAARDVRDQRARGRGHAAAARQADDRRSAAAAIRICVIPEATVSGTHADRCGGRQGSWFIEDLGSTNGSYADHNYERKSQVALLHGGEVQVGECRMKLVSVRPGLAAPPARAAVPREARRPHGPARARAPDEGDRRGRPVRRLGRGADAGRAATSCAGRTARSASARPSSRCSPCGRRRSAVIDLTEMLLLSLTPAVAGPHGAAQVRGLDRGSEHRRGPSRGRAGGLAGSGHAARDAGARARRW